MKKCYLCGDLHIEETVIERYHYTECGLDNIYIAGIKKHKCSSCGEELIELPKLKLLHEIIGKKLCLKGDILSGKEIAFLRKEMRKTGQEFALMLKISAEHLSRIEHGQRTMSGSLDTLVKALYTIYVCEGETVCEGALEAFSGRKSDTVKPHSGLELTPSDWLMGSACCCGV